MQRKQAREAVKCNFVRAEMCSLVARSCTRTRTTSGFSASGKSDQHVWWGLIWFWSVLTLKTTRRSRGLLRSTEARRTSEGRLLTLKTAHIYDSVQSLQESILNIFHVYSFKCRVGIYPPTNPMENVKKKKKKVLDFVALLQSVTYLIWPAAWFLTSRC